jgi:glycine/D-amino acid oxidase-like deaminating enzyme
VRGIETAAGRVVGVVTERSRIACGLVVLAGGAWSRLFCGNLGIELPQLSVLASVMRTDKSSKKSVRNGNKVMHLAFLHFPENRSGKRMGSTVNGSTSPTT